MATRSKRKAGSPHPTATVTGATQGIGLAVARHLAVQGWNVVAVDLSKTGLAHALPAKAHAAAVEGDVREEFTARRVVEAALDSFGQLNGLVSNTDIMIRKPLRKLTLSEWHRVLDTNLTAGFLLARAAEKAAAQTQGRDRDRRLHPRAYVEA